MPTEPAGRRFLPPQPTSFLGRQAELADIARRLADPECRLLTLLGPGGVGKTRLAIEAARQQEGKVPDGVAFVELASLSRVADVPPAIVAVMGLTPGGQAEPWAHLCHLLQHRQMVLVLDNLEHLLESAPRLSELLAAAPGVTLVVTSREALRLQEEWRYPLAGLPLPRSGQAPNPEAGGTDALSLFEERARRARPDFSLDQERDAVLHICRLVEGLPLAIELAAAWTATLPSAAIAADLERDLSWLSTGLRNVPERHRSLQAVFDQSWRLLAVDEQAVFRRLAIFRGGFRREAAHAVAGATPPILAALVAKSLLRHQPDGRYHLHEVVRQFALNQFQAAPDELATVERAFQAYVMAFLAEQGQVMVAGNAREAVGAVASEVSNVLAAWNQPPERVDGAILRLAIPALAHVYHLRGRYREGFELLEGMVQRLRLVDPARPVEPALAAALHEMGQLATRLGRFAEARAALLEARRRYDWLGEPLPRGPATDPEIGLGVLALVDGDASAAARLGEAVRARAEAEGNPGNLPYAWYLTTQAALIEGRYDAARQAATAATAAARAARDDWFLAYGLNDLGTVAAALGEYAVAREHYQASLDARRAFDDLEGMAVALVHLGRVALREGDVTEAGQMFDRARTIYDEIGDRGGLAATLHGLGVAAAARGERHDAARALAQALRIAREIAFAPRLLAITLDAADLLRPVQPGLADEALLLAAQHPAAERETRARARQLASTPGPRAGQEPPRRDAGSDLFSIVDRLLAALAVMSDLPNDDQGGRVPASGPHQLLADPLTERELAVLRLMAAGHSNQQIADELFLAVSTVKWYAGQIFGKLAVRNRTGAVARARELGILQ